MTKTGVWEEYSRVVFCELNRLVNTISVLFMWAMIGVALKFMWTGLTGNINKGI